MWTLLGRIEETFRTPYVWTHFRDIVKNPHEWITILDRASIKSLRSTNGIHTSGKVGSRRSSIDDSGSLSGLSGRGPAAAFNVLKKGRIRFARNPLRNTQCDLTTFYFLWSVRERTKIGLAHLGWLVVMRLTCVGPLIHGTSRRLRSHTKRYLRIRWIRVCGHRP